MNLKHDDANFKSPGGIEDDHKGWGEKCVEQLVVGLMVIVFRGMNL